MTLLLSVPLPLLLPSPSPLAAFEAMSGGAGATGPRWRAWPCALAGPCSWASTRAPPFGAPPPTPPSLPPPHSRTAPRAGAASARGTWASWPSLGTASAWPCTSALQVPFAHLLPLYVHVYVYVYVMCMWHTLGPSRGAACDSRCLAGVPDAAPPRSSCPCAWPWQSPVLAQFPAPLSTLSASAGVPTSLPTPSSCPPVRGPGSPPCWRSSGPLSVTALASLYGGSHDGAPGVLSPPHHRLDPQSPPSCSPLCTP